jgi:peptidoglycan/xylan/chitin deacetylase (PgdA/CDA1 family)
MKKQLQDLVSSISGLFQINHLQKYVNRPIIFPFYHTISDAYLPHISNLYRVKKLDEFYNDIDYLCNNFTPIDITSISNPRATNSKKPYFHLSFDDGLSENYYIAKEILFKKGINATFFINTDFIDNKGLFYRYKVSLLVEKYKSINDYSSLESHFEKRIRSFNEMKSCLLNLQYHEINIIDDLIYDQEIDVANYLNKIKPYLTSEEVHDLIKMGFGIGSHSVDHPHFENLQLEDQIKQYVQSFDFLQNKFGLKEKHFSFPFGSENIKINFFDWMNEHGEIAYSFGVSGLKDDSVLNHYHRIPMEDNKYSGEQILKKQYLYFLLKKPFRKNILQR